MASQNEPEAEMLGGDDLLGLIELQRIDDEIAAMEKKRHARPGELAKKRAAVEDQQRAVAAARDLVISTKKAIDDKNLSAESLGEEAKKLEVQLYSLKSNDDFEKMKVQIKVKQEKKAQFEDKALDLMEAAEELAKKHASEEAALKQAQDDLAAVEQKIGAELAQLESDVDAKKAERAAVAAKLPDLLTELYERTAARRDGEGIAPLRAADQMCSGCFTQVMTQTMNEVMGGKLTQCPHCDRILYLQHSY